MVSRTTVNSCEVLLAPVGRLATITKVLLPSCRLTVPFQVVVLPAGAISWVVPSANTATTAELGGRLPPMARLGSLVRLGTWVLMLGTCSSLPRSVFPRPQAIGRALLSASAQSAERQRNI